MPAVDPSAVGHDAADVDGAVDTRHGAAGGVGVGLPIVVAIVDGVVLPDPLGRQALVEVELHDEGPAPRGLGRSQHLVPTGPVDLELAGDGIRRRLGARAPQRPRGGTDDVHGVDVVGLGGVEAQAADDVVAVEG